MGGGPEYATNGTRIGIDGAGSISWQAACDNDVIDWDKADKAIISVNCTSSTHTPPSASLQLRWQNNTDAPMSPFVPFTTSGELLRGISAGCITNTDPVGDIQNCPSDVIDASEEIENESPLQSASLSASQNDQIEVQFCIDFSNAHDGDEYEFEIYNVTEAESCGACIPKITVYIEPPEGWSGTIDGITDPSSIDGLAVANIDNVDGV